MVNEIKNNKLINGKFNNEKDTNFQKYSELDDITITEEHEDDVVSLYNNGSMENTSDINNANEEITIIKPKELLGRKSKDSTLKSKDKEFSEKSWGATLVFCIVLGFIGFHRFYVGKAGTAILMLLTLGGFGIWIIVDLVSIIINSFTDEDGKVVKRKDAIEQH
ncbi:TM2 domain-containing protein [uncultured Clostridium sp.]|uniref:TM2 domain-containing protein n=1 Tax=uncultured Clostridium sp. TaxID=59620 RepID=UPI003217A13A